jgi:shikimate dehydrogenase
VTSTDGTTSTRHAAVLGSPIAHSLSPVLHRAAYAALGLDWTYDAVEVDEAGLPAFVAGLDGTWAGLSLTMPLKGAVLPLLAEVDPLAAALRSVNTVLPAGDGTWRGTNTDVDGIVQALRRAGVVAPVSATVLGAGATARSAVAALARLGVPNLTVCARRPDAAEAVAALAEAVGVAEALPASLEPDAGLAAADVVVSTLPGDVGVTWVTAAIDAGRGVLLDASYHPWPTPLAAAWTGSAVASGRDMLLWQAVRQVELMTGRAGPADAMAAALPG